MVRLREGSDPKERQTPRTGSISQKMTVCGGTLAFQGSYSALILARRKVALSGKTLERENQRRLFQVQQRPFELTRNVCKRLLLPRAAAGPHGSVKESSNTKSLSSHEKSAELSDEEPSAATAVLMSVLSAAIGSLIGTGGGILLTPLLTAAGVSQRTAQATTQVVVTVTALVSSLRYVANENVDMHLALTLSIFSIVTAPLGARLATRAPARILRQTFGGVLVFASAALLTTAALRDLETEAGISISDLILSTISGGTAFLGGLAGVSGSTLNVPVLTVLTDVSQKTAQGTALLAAVVPSAVASSQQLGAGAVNTRLLRSLVPSAVVGALMGSSVATLLADDSLRLVCAAILAAIGVRYVATAHLAR